MNDAIESLRAEIEETKEVSSSATKLIGGISGRIKSAVDAAMANGATAEELKPLTDELASLDESNTALAAAVAANTSAE